MTQENDLPKIILEPKAIRSIIDKNYFIPDYHRGYRWKETQVTQLLDDIYNFESKRLDHKEQTWYCLQPLVVKAMSSFPVNFEGDKTKEWFEVIDGQQRITTIFLIVHFINEMFRGKQKDNEPTIIYQTMKKSFEFLVNLSNNGNSSVCSFSNIDFHHISSAYISIANWFTSSNITIGLFIRKFYDLTKVIWHEPLEDDAFEIFKRLNTGKIQLTNAESNLQKDDLGASINKKDNNTPTRIEILLDLIKKKPEEVNDENYLFSEFFKEFKNVKEYMLSKQFLGSGSSERVRVRESENSESKAEFIYTLPIAQKELNEAWYWLELLEKTNYLNKDEYDSLDSDAVKIIKIITNILKTSKGVQL